MLLTKVAIVFLVVLLAGMAYFLLRCLHRAV